MTFANTDVTDLISLVGVEEVLGDLRFENNQQLMSLIDLMALTKIGGSLVVTDNDNLTDVKIPSLVHIGADLIITDNVGLCQTTVDGFANQVSLTVDGTSSFDLGNDGCN